MENNKRTAGTWKTEGLTVTCYGSGIICKCILPKDGGCFDAIGNAQIISKAVNEYDKLKDELSAYKSENVDFAYIINKQSADMDELAATNNETIFEMEKEKLHLISERDLLIGALKNIISEFEDKSVQMKTPIAYFRHFNKAEELLSNIKK